MKELLILFDSDWNTEGTIEKYKIRLQSRVYIDKRS